MATIGRYIVERELGRGAMGVVYLATDPRLGRKVAVKTYTLPDGVSPELAAQFHERFIREARAAASLSHPGLVTVYDAGEDAEQRLPYIAMEFVDGRSLKQLLEEKGKLDAARVLAWASVLAEALGVAHRAGIVHRDIKPANILIREEDSAAKITDFGVVHLKSSELTQTGTAPGSPGYMSPEQITSGQVDGRSDLFSLAVVLYEALCGRRPFKGDDLVSLAYSIAHETQVPLARQLPGCPEALDRFFERALCKDPAKRFHDAAAFRAGLLEAAQARPAPEGTAARGPAPAAEKTIIEPVSAATVPLSDLPPGRRPEGAPVPGGRFEGAPAPGTPAPRAKRFGARLAAMGFAVVAIAAAGWFVLAGPDGLRALPRARPAVSASNAPAAASPGGSSSPAAPAPGTPLPRREDILQEVTPVPEPPPRPAATRPAASTSSPARPPQPKPVQVTLPAGTTIEVALESQVGSASSRVGEPVTVKVTQAVVSGSRVPIPSGSRIRGQVSAVAPAHKGLGDKGGSITLSFDRLLRGGGSGTPLAASVTRTGGSSKGKTAGAIGGGAAGGAILGKVLGKSSKDAALGTVLGAAIGTGVAAGTRGEEVTLQAGAPLSLVLDRPLTLSVRP